MLNPCPVCQDRQTCSRSVWLLDPWNIAPNPRLHVLYRQGTHSISFPWTGCKWFCSTWKIEMLVVFILGRITCRPEMAAECQWRMPFNRQGDFQQLEVEPALGGEAVGMDEGKEKAGRGEQSPKRASCSTTMGNLVWAVALNTSILTWGEQEIGFL